MIFEFHKFDLKFVIFMFYKVLNGIIKNFEIYSDAGIRIQRKIWEKNFFWSEKGNKPKKKVINPCPEQWETRCFIFD